MKTILVTGTIHALNELRLFLGLPAAKRLESFEAIVSDGPLALRHSRIIGATSYRFARSGIPGLPRRRKHNIDSDISEKFPDLAFECYA